MTSIKTMHVPNLKLKIKEHERRLSSKGNYPDREYDRKMVKECKEELALMPWNYDMDSAPVDKSILIKRKNGNVIKASFVANKWSVRSAVDGDYVEIKQAIAWLPLPEQKL